MADTGVVNIHGRQYETVALRVQKFRDKFPAWTLKTIILHRDTECVLVEAQILDDAGRLIANGHAEEWRKSSSINKTSALENSETSAIGRALAAFGLGGTEFAAADEVANAITRKQTSPITPTDGAMESLSIDQQQAARDDADYIVSRWEEGDKAGAYDAYKTLLEGDQMYAVAVWACLKPYSKIRSELKAMKAEERKAA
jgi:hypothetical protein